MPMTITVTESPTYITVNETNNEITLNQSDNPITVTTSTDLVQTEGTSDDITVNAHNNVYPTGSLTTALQKLGYRCGMMGTLGCGVPDALERTLLTTPDAVFSQWQLAQMVSKNCKHVAMEVSSVGLDQKRVEAIRFDTAVFTNLTRDHLDYHQTLDEYFGVLIKKYKLNSIIAKKHTLIILLFFLKI